MEGILMNFLNFFGSHVSDYKIDLYYARSGGPLSARFFKRQRFCVLTHNYSTIKKNVTLVNIIHNIPERLLDQFI